MRLAKRFLLRVGESGSVAGEYALTLPFLLGLIYGIIEVGHYAYLRITMANTTHDAARYAAVHGSQATTPATSSDVKTFVNNELTALGLNPDGTGGTAVTVTYTPDNNPGSTVQVSISYRFVPFMAGFDQIPGTSTSFTALSGPILGSAQLTISP
jgi:Flp pilus assembly protein TadG